MLNFLKKIFKPPTLRGLSLKASIFSVSLDGLKTGVDNIRHDVHLSDSLCKSVHDLVLLVMVRHTRAEEILNPDKTVGLADEKEQFKRLCSEVLKNAIHKAKLMNQTSVNTLAQIAVVKLLLKEIRGSYDNLLEMGSNMVREYEIASKREKAISLKNKLTNLTQQQNTYLCEISREIFQYLSEVQQHGLNEMRRVVFGDEAIFPDHIFQNPMLYAQNPSDHGFMIEEYDIIMGLREEDSDKYEALKELILRTFSEIHAEDGTYYENFGKIALAWIGDEENVDILFNHFQTRHQAQVLKKKKADNSEIRRLKEEAELQKRRLDFFYKQFDKAELIQKIVALYEMGSVYREYCPPLVPQVVLQYLLFSSARKAIRQRLERSKRFYSKTFSSEALDMAAKRVKKTGRAAKKAFLMRFLKAFFRYHRDFQSAMMLKDAMKTIHLATEEKIIRLSKANNTLYEFLLTHESESEEKPIIRHVIVKADVRGSTDITHRMTERGLNPASYFSLNLFDPITEVLSDYDASKVFVEGDAIILSVFEREETPEGWYSVARACGLAMNMISIIQRYNTRNQEYQLPVIELGIGIRFKDGAPLFLFDGTNRIMISSAINLADRLSGCSKAARKRRELSKGHFNLYVFQTVSDDEMSQTADDLFMRYNVNGIELNSPGFKKLRNEIDLKCISANISDFGASKMNFYAGKFPTVNGEYQYLVIREASVPHINPDTFEILKITHRNYYEVCTNPKICEQIRKTAKL